MEDAKAVKDFVEAAGEPHHLSDLLVRLAPYLDGEHRMAHMVECERRAGRDLLRRDFEALLQRFPANILPCQR